MSARRRSCSGRLGLLAALGCALATLPTAAAGRHSSRHGGPPGELVATAQAQARAGDHAAARATLEQAYRLAPGPEILCALGELLAKDGRVLEAQDALRRCTAGSTRTAASPAASPPQSGELSISGPRHALVVVDEHVVGALPLPLPLLLAPGPHRVALEAGSHRWHAAVQVLPGRGALLTLAGQAKVTLMPAVALLVDFSHSPDEAAPLLQQAATQAVKSRRLGLLGQWGALGEPLELAACQDAPCEQALAQKHKVRYVVAARVAAEPDGWQLWTQLFDAEVGGVASEQAADCERCTVEQAGQRLGELLTQTLTTGQSRPTGVLEITSTPPGGDVLLAGLRLGQTPLRRIAFAGEHAIVVQRAGFAPYQNEVVVEPGRGAALDATLRESAAAAALSPPSAPSPPNPPNPPNPSNPSSPSSPPSPPSPPSPSSPSRLPSSPGLPSELAVVLHPRPAAPTSAPSPPHTSDRAARPRWRVGLGIAASAAGATLLGFGAAGLALDGRCTQAPQATPSGELCPSGRVVDSSAAGAGLLAAGLSTLGAGTLLWALPGARKLELTATVTPTPTAGVAVTAGGAF